MSGSELIALGSHYSQSKGIGNIRDHAQAPCREEGGLPGIALLLSFLNREIQGSGSVSGIFALVTPGLMSPIQLQCEQGLVSTPDVFAVLVMV